MQTSESQQQLGSLSFTMSMVSAPVDFSQRATTSSIVSSRISDDAMIDTDKDLQAHDQYQDDVGLSSSTILLPMKSPKRTPNRLSLNTSVISSSNE